MKTRFNCNETFYYLCSSVQHFFLPLKESSYSLEGVYDFSQPRDFLSCPSFRGSVRSLSPSILELNDQKLGRRVVVTCHQSIRFSYAYNWCVGY